MEFLACLSFFLFVSVTVADAPFNTDLEAYQDGAFGDMPSQTFHSSDLVSTLWQVNAFDADDPRLDPSPYLFLNADYNGHSHPFIFSTKDLSLVWTARSRDDADPSHTTSVVLGTLHGEPAMTITGPDKKLGVMIWNQRYDLLYTVRPQGNYSNRNVDPHEGALTEDDTVMLIVSEKDHFDMTEYGGKEDQPVRDCIVQEIDPGTNTLLFESDTADHFTPHDSYYHNLTGNTGNPRLGQDWNHLNSVSKTAEGDYLVGARHLWAVWLVDGKTGDIKWILGGKKNQFKDITENGTAEFRWQHEPRLIAPNRITLFDNHWMDGNDKCDTEKEFCSRGLELEIDTEEMTVKVVAEFHHPQALKSATRGGVQRLPNGNTLVAWGQNPMYTEHAPDGSILMDIQRGRVMAIEHGIVGITAYRGYKGYWVGEPKWGPNISAIHEKGQTNIYVSWNGATEVQRYLLLASDNATTLNDMSTSIASSRRTGFESRITLEENAEFARIVALNYSDHAIGVTPIVNTRTGELSLDNVYKTMHSWDTSGDERVDQDVDFAGPVLVGKPRYEDSFGDDGDNDGGDSWLPMPLIWMFVGLLVGLLAVTVCYSIRTKKNKSNLLGLRPGWSKIPDEEQDDGEAKEIKEYTTTDQERS